MRYDDESVIRQGRELTIQSLQELHHLRIVCVRVEKVRARSLCVEMTFGIDGMLQILVQINKCNVQLAQKRQNNRQSRRWNTHIDATRHRHMRGPDIEVQARSNLELLFGNVVVETSINTLNIKRYQHTHAHTYNGIRLFTRLDTETHNTMTMIRDVLDRLGGGSNQASQSQQNNHSQTRHDGGCGLMKGKREATRRKNQQPNVLWRIRSDTTLGNAWQRYAALRTSTTLFLSFSQHITTHHNTSQHITTHHGCCYG
jgi:hypothetical protein